MTKYSAKNLKKNDTKITLDIDTKGTLTADFAEWADLVLKIGGASNIEKVKLLGDDLLEFPNDIHVEIEDFIFLAEKQKNETNKTSIEQKLPASASLLKALNKLTK